MGLYGNIFINKENNISISVDGDGATNRGYSQDPYFKIYNDTNPRIASKVARISLLEPRYIIHNNQRWELNSKEKKKLMKYLVLPVVVQQISFDSLWEAIKYFASKESETNDEVTKNNIINLQLPDYTKL